MLESRLPVQTHFILEKTKYGKLKVDCAKISQNYERVSRELSVKNQALEAKNHELIEGQLKLGIAESNMSSLRQSLSAAEDKIIALRDDYLFISQEKTNLEGQVKQLHIALAT